MNRKIFKPSGQLNDHVFEPAFFGSRFRFNAVVEAAKRTRSALIESTHFLIALLAVPDGLARALFKRHGLTAADLEPGLEACCYSGGPDDTVQSLTARVLDHSAAAVVSALEKEGDAGEPGKEFIGEGDLLLAVLENLTPAVIANLTVAQLDHRELILELRREIDRDREYTPPVLFDRSSLCIKSFSPMARRVLELMQREAGALGFEQIDPRHLLLGLLENEGGSAHSAIYQQNLVPKKIQERLVLNLRGQASKQNTRLELERERMSETLTAILSASVREAASGRFDAVAEVHLFRAFLRSGTFALQLFADAGLDIDLAKEAAQRFDPAEEPDVGDSGAMQSLESIKAGLQDALVGQSDVIDACLPIIRRLLFRFRRPGKPAGVFIFCGPSGMGKTEMAKAIARAVFGSEDHLIMLEMGQFQTKESMNIFIGAPPGYIGYGEGKLTNGLRDKPHAVVLFDEIEKAHPEVFDTLLRFIDEGKIDDPAGPIRDGSECIIVMTSNVRTDELEKKVESSSSRENKWIIRRKIKEALLNLPVDTGEKSRERSQFRFRPEFLNRVDEIILFRTLSGDDYTEIARRHLEEYRERLKEEKQVHLEFSPMLETVARLIGSFCSTIEEGARAALRVCQTAVIDPVIDFVIEHQSQPPVSLVIHFPQDPEVVEEPRGIVDFLTQTDTD